MQNLEIWKKSIIFAVDFWKRFFRIIFLLFGYGDVGRRIRWAPVQHPISIRWKREATARQAQWNPHKFAEKGQRGAGFPNPPNLADGWERIRSAWKRRKRNGSGGKNTAKGDNEKTKMLNKSCKNTFFVKKETKNLHNSENCCNFAGFFAWSRKLAGISASTRQPREKQKQY